MRIVFAVSLLLLTRAEPQSQCDKDLEKCGCELRSFEGHHKTAVNKDYSDRSRFLKYDFFVDVGKACGYGTCIRDCVTKDCDHEKEKVANKMSQLTTIMQNTWMKTICERTSLDPWKTLDHDIRMLVQLQNDLVYNDREECYKDLDACECDTVDYIQAFTEEVNYDVRDPRMGLEYLMRICAHENCQKVCSTTKCEDHTEIKETLERLFAKFHDHSYRDRLKGQCEKTRLDTAYDDAADFGRSEGHLWTSPVHQKCQEELNARGCNLGEFEKGAEMIKSKQHMGSESTVKICREMNCIEKSNTSKACKSVRSKVIETRELFEGMQDNHLGKRLLKLCENIDSSTAQKEIEDAQELEKTCEDQLNQCGGCGVQNYSSFHEAQRDYQPTTNRERAKVLYKYCAFYNCIAKCENDCGYNTSTYRAAAEKIERLKDEKEPDRVRNKCAAATMESAFNWAMGKINGYLLIVSSSIFIF